MFKKKRLIEFEVKNLQGEAERNERFAGRKEEGAHWFGWDL